MLKTLDVSSVLESISGSESVGDSRAGVMLVNSSSPEVTTSSTYPPSPGPLATVFTSSSSNAQSEQLKSLLTRALAAQNSEAKTNVREARDKSKEEKKTATLSSGKQSSKEKKEKTYKSVAAAHSSSSSTGATTVTAVTAAEKKPPPPKIKSSSSTKAPPPPKDTVKAQQFQQATADGRFAGSAFLASPEPTLIPLPTFTLASSADFFAGV